MRPGSNSRRPRGRPNRKQHVPSRSQAYDSHGPDVRIRGNAPQVYEKYLSLARDATSSGDRVAAESYYQFAEHYFRIMNDTTDPQRQSQPRPRPDGEQPAPSRDQRPADREQPATSREQGLADREQPHVEWPVTPEQGVKPVESKPEPGPDASAAAIDAQSEPEPEAETSNSEEKAARPAPKTRQRTRRRATNGSESAPAKRAKRREDGADEPDAADAAEDEPAESTLR